MKFHVHDHINRPVVGWRDFTLKWFEGNSSIVQKVNKAEAPLQMPTNGAWFCPSFQASAAYLRFIKDTSEICYCYAWGLHLLKAECLLWLGFSSLVSYVPAHIILISLHTSHLENLSVFRFGLNYNLLFLIFLVLIIPDLAFLFSFPCILKRCDINIFFLKIYVFHSLGNLWIISWKLLMKLLWRILLQLPKSFFLPHLRWHHMEMVFFLFTNENPLYFILRKITLCSHVICPKNILPTYGLKIDTLPTWY